MGRAESRRKKGSQASGRLRVGIQRLVIRASKFETRNAKHKSRRLVILRGFGGTCVDLVGKRNRRTVAVPADLCEFELQVVGRATQSYFVPGACVFKQQL